MNEKDFSTCINFQTVAFDRADIDLDVQYERTMHFDPWYDWDGRDNDPVELIGAGSSYDSTLPVCEAHRGEQGDPFRGLRSRELLPSSDDEKALKDYIRCLHRTGQHIDRYRHEIGHRALGPKLASGHRRDHRRRSLLLAQFQPLDRRSWLPWGRLSQLCLWRWLLYRRNL